MAKKNVIILMLAFLFIFMGYDTAQQYLSSIFYTQNIALISFISLSLIYLSSIFSTFYAPFLCRKLGLKKSLFLASLIYPLFILMIILKSEILLYIFSVLLGAAAPLLWTAHGTYLIKATEEKNRGFYSGLSFSSLVLGSSIMIFLISYFVEKVGYPIIFSVLAIASFMGAVLLLFLQDIKENKEYNLHPKQILAKKQTLFLIPLIFCPAFTFGLIVSKIPIRITDLFGVSYVGKIAAIFMVSLMIITFIYGKLSDKIGFKKLVFLSLISGVLGFMIIIFSANFYLFSIGIILLALDYSSYLALSYPIVSKLFMNELDSAMAVRWIIFATAMITAIIGSSFLGFHELAVIGVILAVIALFSSKLLFSLYLK